MRFLVDTNVLVAAAMSGLPQHREAYEFMRTEVAGAKHWCLSWVNVYEFLRVTTHRKVFPKPLSWQDAYTRMAKLMEHQGLEILAETDSHFRVAKEVAAAAGSVSGNFVHDCHVAALMVEHEVQRIVTYDSDFRKFGHLIVSSPGEFLRG